MSTMLRPAFLDADVPRSTERVADTDSSWIWSLSPDEAYAVLEYTQTGYRALNQALRDGESLSADLAQLHRNLAAVMDKAPESQLRTLYRAQSLPELPSIGDEVSFGCYLSTTADASLVPGYFNPYDDHAVILEIMSNRSVDINALSVKEGREREFLIAAGARFRVHNVFVSDWITTCCDEEAGVSYDHRHLSKVTVVQLVQL